MFGLFNNGDKSKNQQENVFNQIKLSEILVNVFNTKMSFEDIANVFSKDIDQIIINNKKNQLKYVGGIFSIYLYDDKNFRIGYQVYFKENSGKYLNKSAESDSMSIDYLDNSSLKELIANKKVEFNIDEPEENVQV